jgi:hypothetical protein
VLRFAAHARMALIALMALAAAPRCPADQVVDILLNGGAEQCDGGKPGDWYAAHRPAPSLRMWVENGTAFSGRNCFAIANQDTYEPPVSNNWAQKLRFIPEGKVLRLAGRIRTEDAESANICVQCWGADGRLIGLSSTPVYRGTHDWTYVQAPDMVVPPLTKELTVRAALTGKGKAFFDDLFLGIIGDPKTYEDDLREQVTGRILRVVPVTKDSMVLAYLPRWSHGDIDNIGIANNHGGVRLLLEWEQPAPEEVARPNLQFLLALFAREMQGSGTPAPVDAHEVLEAWSEIISWGEQPRFAEHPATTFKIPVGMGWKILDMSPLIREQAKADRRSHGVVLRFAQEDRDTQAADLCGYGFVSREGIGEHENRRPVFLVVDPDQLPSGQPVGGIRARKPPVPTSRVFFEYIEYLAGNPGARIEVVPEAGPASLKARKKADDLAAQEEFIRRYPLTPEGLQMMESLATEFCRTGRPADALRLSDAAMRLAKDTDLSCLTQIGQARLEASTGRLDAAEARLRSVMVQPVPEDPGDRRIADILFGAREALAEVLRKKGQSQQADENLVDLADHAIRHAQLHAEQKALAHSWAMTAYKKRIQFILDLDRDDMAAARKLIEEFEQKIPDYRGPEVPGGTVLKSAAGDELNAWIQRLLSLARPAASTNEGK